MLKGKNFICAVPVFSFICLILGICTSRAEEQDRILRLAQTRSYERIFPESVSPAPEDIQARDARLKMEAEVEQEKELSETGQKEAITVSTKEKPVMLAGREPTKIYYKISVNDRLYIAVWRVPDLSMEFVVGPDGYISFPLIGDIRAAGKTLSELDAEITGKLKEYVEDPQVSVVIREFAGDQVTVIGDVVRPGIYKFVGEIKIIDVIALAGGFTDRARSSSIVIVREPDDPQKDVNLVVADIKSILKGHYKSNIEVKPYDIIYVSRTLVSNVQEFYTNFIVPAFNSAVDLESYRSIRRTRIKGSD